MALQDYDSAIQNMVKSTNARFRTACQAISARLGITVNWYPQGEKPKEPVYPYVSIHFLNYGRWDSRRMRLCSDGQLDVFTNQRKQAEARRIGGALLTELGVSLDNHLQACDIPQTDSETGLNIPLLPISFEVGGGFEPLGDPDPSITHLFSEFTNYHE